MQVMMITLVLGSALAALTPPPNARAQAADPIIGTWKIDLAKSKFRPGPPPKSVTITYEAAGNGVKTSATGVDGEGKPIKVENTASYDGKDYPVTGSADYETASYKRIGARTVEVIRKKGGKVVQRVRRVVSKDGKRYTVTTKGTNAKGQHIDNVAVYDKQ